MITVKFVPVKVAKQFETKRGRKVGSKNKVEVKKTQEQADREMGLFLGEMLHINDFSK